MITIYQNINKQNNVSHVLKYLFYLYLNCTIHWYIHSMQCSKTDCRVQRKKQTCQEKASFPTTFFEGVLFQGYTADSPIIKRCFLRISQKSINGNIVVENIPQPSYLNMFNAPIVITIWQNIMKNGKLKLKLDTTALDVGARMRIEL